MTELTIEKKREIILQCVTEGDWSVYGNMITRDDLMEYLMFYTNPEINEKSLKIKKLPKIDCPLCGKTGKPHAQSFTRRNVLYLMSASFLSKQDIAKGGEGYVHYEIIHDFVQHKFKHDKGKRLGQGFSITTYSPMTIAPWDFLQARQNTNEKTKRDGYFKPTDKCYQFLHPPFISVPERIEILDKICVRASRRLVSAISAKDINFKELVENFKTF